MIIALLSDPLLRASVRRAAWPDEDVFWRPHDAREALRLGFPRLAVASDRGPHPLGDPRSVAGQLPLLILTEARVQAWEASRTVAGYTLRRVDHHGLRLRQLMTSAAGPVDWVSVVLRDLGRAAGAPLPPALRGMGRRVLEFPSRYEDLHSLADLSGISRGALKARFRRRDLPSPYTYLRWFRLLAAAHVLSDPDVSTERAAYRMGLHSSGNLCRFLRSMAGLTPSDLRRPFARARLTVDFAERCLGTAELERWPDLEELFLEGAA